jgi:type I restriction enzyme R subunit
MPAPGEYKTVQARILKYAQEIGWTYVPRAEAERRRGFDPDGATPQDRARKASLFFGNLLHAQVRAFNRCIWTSRCAITPCFRPSRG